MSILKEIHQQPEPVRHLMFLLSVIATVSFLGAIWLNSFQRDVFALMNPSDQYEARYYAQGKPSPFSPVAIANKGVDVLRAGIYTVLGLNKDNSQNNNATQSPKPLLPLSKDKF
jgi:hypothetical protein